MIAESHFNLNIEYWKRDDDSYCHYSRAACVGRDLKNCPLILNRRTLILLDYVIKNRIYRKYS